MKHSQTPSEIEREFQFHAAPADEKVRLDRFLKNNLSDYSRNQIQRWIEKGSVLVAGKSSFSSAKLKAGEEVRVSIPEEEISVVPEKIPLEILYEDEAVLAINKAAGMVTHPAHGHYSGTLANAVAHHLKGKKAKKFPDGMRLGLVHRLDKETSGILLIAKSKRAMDVVLKQFEDRSIHKVYRALVSGRIDLKKGEIEGAIGKEFGSGRMAVVATGRFARTEFKVLKRFPHNTYLGFFDGAKACLT